MSPSLETRHLASDSNPHLHPNFYKCSPQHPYFKSHTFIFLSLVIISTVSDDNGTGDPIPISCPVSRGSNLTLDFSSPSPSKSSGIGESVSSEGFRLSASGLLSLSKCGGGAGAARCSQGITSTPPLPRLGPYEGV